MKKQLHELTSREFNERQLAWDKERHKRVAKRVIEKLRADPFGNNSTLELFAAAHNVHTNAIRAWMRTYWGETVHGIRKQERKKWKLHRLQKWVSASNVGPQSK